MRTRGRSPTPTSPEKETQMANRTTIISTVHYPLLNRGTTDFSTVHYPLLNRSLPTSQPLTLLTSQPCRTVEMPLHVVLHEDLNLSVSFEHAVFARGCSRSHALVAPGGRSLADWASSAQAKKEANPKEVWRTV